jgi:hypothetical protein
VSTPSRPLFFLTFLLLFVSFFPGLLIFDAYVQLNDVLSHNIHDWHSPIMSWIWGQFNRIYPGPAPFLAVDQIFGFLALFLILRAAFSSWRAQFIALLCVVFLPPNFLALGTVSKDAVFCAAMILAMALALHSHSESLRWRIFCLIAALLLLLFAISVRPEGIAAAFPVFAWMVWGTMRHPNLRSFFSVAVPTAIALCAVSLFGIELLNNQIAGGRHSYPQQVIFEHDLAAISLGTGSLLVPPTLRTDHASLAEVRLAYVPTIADSMFWGDQTPFKTVTSPEDYAVLRGQWLQQIWQHPSVYLAHRLEIFLNLLGFGDENGRYALVFNTWEHPAEFYQINRAHFTPTFLVRLEHQIYVHLDRFLVFRPFLFLLAALGVIVALMARRSLDDPVDQMAITAAVSGVFHIGIFFFVCPGSTVRYGHWLMLSATLALVLCVGRHIRGGPSESAERPLS